MKLFNPKLMEIVQDLLVIGMRGCLRLEFTTS